MSSPIYAQDSGAYLALRQAFADSDDERVSDYLKIELKRDPDNPILQEEAVLSSVYNLDLEGAMPFAERLKVSKPNSMALEVVEFAEMIKMGHFEDALAYMDGVESLKFVSPEIIRAWSMVEAGNADQAIQYLEQTADEQGELGFLYDFQRAMIEAYANKNYQEAADILGNKGEAIHMSDLSFYSHAALLKLANSPAFDVFMDESYGAREKWPGFIEKLISSAEAGEIDPSLNFVTPQNALGEYLSALISSSQNGNLDYGVERLLRGMTPAFAPENAWFIYQYMQYFEQRGEFEDVIEFAERIKKSSFIYAPAMQMRADVLLSLDRKDEARSWADGQETTAPDEIAFKADIYRRLEDYEMAAQLYEASLAILGEDSERALWVLYGLGVCYERLGEWEKAEAKFLKALALAPDNPDILNYLGYTYVDRGQNLEEGLGMIEKAVNASPNEWHIIDSLGWAYYRLGRYEEALEPLERAASMSVTDPIVNAHLGDLYWQLGRKREANFQWRRSVKYLEQDSQDLSMAELEDRLANGLPQ